MIIDIFLNYLIVHIKFSMKYYYFILKLKRSFVYAVLSLSLLLSPSLTHFFVIRLNGKLSTARQRRRMRNEAKIKLIYKWRKKINKNTQQKAKHFFIYPSRAVPFLRLPLHQQPPPAHVPGQSPAMALSGQPVAPFVKN